MLGDPGQYQVTGAAMVIRREHFQALGFNTEYRVCGRRRALLALRRQLKLNVVYCPLSGEHGGEATRSNDKNQEAKEGRYAHTRTTSTIPEHHEH